MDQNIALHRTDRAGYSDLSHKGVLEVIGASGRNPDARHEVRALGTMSQRRLQKGC